MQVLMREKKKKDMPVTAFSHFKAETAPANKTEKRLLTQQNPKKIPN